MQNSAFSSPIRIRSLRAAVGLTALLVSMRAAAQAEVERPQPNVLLLVDTSGSMEFKTDGELPTCNEDDATDTNDKSRWIELVEVLTGTIEGYSCWAQDRSSTAFRDEFSLSSVDPYDFGYGNPYHRALSNSCVYGPGVPSPSSSPFEWNDNSINTFEFATGAVDRPDDSLLASHPGCEDYSQLDNGLLDVFRNQVRFGLMTFDTRIDPGTGLSGTSADIADGVKGTWSYYLDEPVTGSPANCELKLPQEIGARNGAAPPWEGRMVSFGATDGSETEERNEWVQKVLLSTRPYGATPIAGLLQDAQNFLWNDTTLDPLAPSSQPREFGPTNDPSWRATNCRKSLVILLTDGEPNLDLRPSCDEETTPPETPGVCPYDKPEDIVRDLRVGGAPTASLAVETYVIGFALGEVTPDGTGTPIPCDELTSQQCTDNVDPNKPETKRIQACCTLNLIAGEGSVDVNGEGRKAYFANNPAELRDIFAEILDDVVQVATRTQPVFGGRGGDTSTQGFKFFSAFNPNPNPTGPSQLWEGVLKRTRFQCTDEENGLIAEEAGPDVDKGDDFARNMGAASGDDRRFYTYLSAGDNRNSVRPFITGDPDELDSSTGTAVAGTTAAAFAALIDENDMGITDDTCGNGVEADACSALVLKHAIGLENADGLDRCPAPDDCDLLGGIYHSTPTIVPGRPPALLRDNSYRAFVTAMSVIERPSTLYTSTVDGFLHAFDLAPFPGSSNADDNRVDKLENNELWALIPPAVLTTLHAQYPSTPIVLLDGLPIIRDVVARSEGTNIIMERTQDDAKSTDGLWRTVMVQGFGDSPVTKGYFAVDITDPRRAGGAPKFLWQLTRTGSNQELFGSNGTPLITTVFIGDSTNPGLEIPVAVLPGGSADPETDETTTDIGQVMITDPTDFAIDQPTRRYNGNSRVAARSLTIVRLDTGEVLKTFRPASSPIAFAAGIAEDTVIPAPIVGQPVAFPSGAGAIAERIFVGDAEGRLYRLDVSSKDPDNWSMKVFFDAYWNDTDPSVRQPVELPPMLSVNDDAEVTIAFATGDQEAIVGGSDMVNRVISLTEQLNTVSNTFEARVNWIHDLPGGVRTTGPMVLFNKGLYYAASNPPDAESASCDRGSSEVFGVHYILDAATQADPEATPSLNAPGYAPGATSINFSGAQEGLIFGVSLESQPSCSSAEEVISGDEGFGYGEVKMSKQTKAGKFFLSYEASGNSGPSGGGGSGSSGEGSGSSGGGGSGSSGGGSGSTSGVTANGITSFQTELKTAQRPVSLESFALIYE